MSTVVQSLVFCVQPVSSRRHVPYPGSMSEMAPRRSRGAQRGLLLGSERPSKRSSPRTFPSQSMFLTKWWHLHQTMIESYWKICVFFRPSYSADSDLRGRGDASGRRVGPARFLDNMNIRAKREYDRRNGLWVFCTCFVLSRFYYVLNLNKMPNICCRGVSPEEKRGGRGAWNWGCVEAARLVNLTVVICFGK